jgi:hypothetical protein
LIGPRPLDSIVLLDLEGSTIVVSVPRLAHTYVDQRKAARCANGRHNFT